MLYGVWAILNVLALIKLGFKASFLLIPFVSFVEIYVIVGYLLTNYLKKKLDTCCMNLYPCLRIMDL